MVVIRLVQWSIVYGRRLVLINALSKIKGTHSAMPRLDRILCENILLLNFGTLAEKSLTV